MDSNVQNVLDEYFSDLRTYFGLFYSFDLMFNQVDWIDFSWRKEQKSIYQYLKSRGDVVVSLVRDKRDIFLSMKTLEITNKAHFTLLDRKNVGSVDLAAEILGNRKIALDYDEYKKFCENLERDRNILLESFFDYERLILVDYDEVKSDYKVLTNKMNNIIRDFGCSIGHDFGDNPSPFPNLVKYSADYAKIFENFDEISDMDE